MASTWDTQMFHSQLHKSWDAALNLNKIECYPLLTLCHKC